MNRNFRKVALAVRSINKKDGSMFKDLAAFAHEFVTTCKDMEASVKDAFKVEEVLASAEFKMEIGKNSTYRSNKSVLVKAVEAGVSLVDDKGRFKGKTALEAELEALAPAEPAKSDYDKFVDAVNKASKLVDGLDAQQCLTAASLVQGLLTTLTPKLALAA
jgi:hypothetical protein